MKKIVRIITLVIATVAMFTLAACNHTHTYDTTKWTYDATMHWHAATCKHTDEISDVQGHIDENKDGACDVCDYADHEHVTNNIGVCTVCGYNVATPDVSTVAKAIDLAVKQGDIIGSGHVTTTTDLGYGATTINGIYEVATDYTHTVGYYPGYYGWTVKEAWYVGYGEDQVLALVNNEGEVGLSYNEVSAQNVDGWYFDGSFVAYADVFYGVEDLVASTYAIAIDESKVQGEVVESVEDGVYTFAFVYIDVASEDIVNVSVSFTIGEEYNFDTVSIASERFYYPVLDEETGLYSVEEGTVADAKFTVEVTQAVGECVANPYEVDELFLESFKLVDAEGADVAETVTTTQGEQVALTIVGTPEDLALTFENIVVSAVNTETDEEVAFDWWGDYVSSVDTYSNTVSVKIVPVGEYEVTVSSRLYSQTFTLVVEKPQTTEIYTSVNDAQVAETSCYTGMPVSVEVKANQYADTAHEITFVTAEGSALSTELTINETTGMYEFTPDVVGTYVITVTSTAANKAEDIASWTLTITAENPPAITDILTGSWADSYGSFMLDFTPDATPAEGAEASGTAVITIASFWSSEEYTVSYVYANGELTVEPDPNDYSGFVFALNSNFGLDIVVNGLTQATLEKVDASANPALDFIVDKTFAGEYAGVQVYFTFTRYEDSYECTIQDVYMGRPSWAVSYTYEIGADLGNGMYLVELTQFDSYNEGAPVFDKVVLDINYQELLLENTSNYDMAWLSLYM